MDKKTWQGKINRGRYVERQILRWIKKNMDKEAIIPVPHVDEYNITSVKLGNVEIKEDRMAHVTGNYAIEFEDGHKLPSGIEKTTAKFFIIVDYEYVIFLPTDSLKYIIRSTPDIKEVVMGAKFHDGVRSLGWLLPRNKLLLSPFAKVCDRWFPVLQENEVRD